MFYFTRCILSTRRCSRRLSGKSATGFWKKFSHPSMSVGVDKKELAAYLREWSKGRVSHRRAEEVLDLVNSSLETEDQKPSHLELVRCRIIKSLLREFNLLEKEILLVKEKLEELVENAGYKLRTMPGVDFTTEARIISVIENTDRFSSGAKIAKFCGIAPCEKSSGKRRRRKRSNRGERQQSLSIHCIAISQIGVSRKKKPKDPIARAYYLKKLAEGKTKKQAITCLKRRLCDIIYAMMRKRLRVCDVTTKRVFSFSNSRFCC